MSLRNSFASLMALGLLFAGARAQAADAPAVAVALAAEPPAGATVLFGADPAAVQANWYKRGTKNDCGWKQDDKGVVSPADKTDITSKASFGDCFMHLEFKCPVDAAGKPVTSGNSGIGFMGRYELQIFNSFGQTPNNQNCGALYNQKPARAIASKPAGEWNVYDVIFRAPRFDADGKVTEKARVTAFLNGVLVQVNNEFNGPTGIQYGDFPGEVATAPIVLQGNHDPVSFRNTWIVPLTQ